MTKPIADPIESHVETSGVSVRPSASELARRDRVAKHQDGQESVAAEFYRRHDLYRNEAAEELLRHEIPTLDAGELSDIVACVQENREIFLGRQRQPAAGHGAGARGGAAPSIGELRDDFQVLREQIEISVANRDRYVKKHGDAVMAEKCMWLHLGFPLLAGAADQAALVKLLGRGKATVNKCLQYFQAETPKLPILPGQRSQPGRKNMELARRDQLPANGNKLDLRLKDKLTEAV